VRVVRRRHRGQLGLTLVEMLVTIAIMGVGVVGIAASFGAVERNSSTGTDQTALEVSMRHVTDYVRSSAVPYSFCAPVAAPYPNLFTKQANGTWQLPDGTQFTLAAQPQVTLTQATSADWNGGTTEPPIYDCSASIGQGVATCAAGHYCDWGVQRITVKLTAPPLLGNPSRTLSRDLFKSYR
jgi:prepilin-type N-terminal cleavage/methylation domain-containing protein